MADPVLVQSAVNSAGNVADIASVGTAWPGATAAGNLLVAVLTCNGNPGNITVPAGWNLGASVSSGASAAGNDVHIRVFYILNAPSQSGTKTFSWDGIAVLQAILHLQEWHGSGPCWVDGSSSATGVTANPSAGLLAAIGPNNELLISANGQANLTTAITFTEDAGSSFVIDNQTDRAIGAVNLAASVGHLITATNATDTLDSNVSTQWASVAISFGFVPSGGTVLYPRTNKPASSNAVPSLGHLPIGYLAAIGNQANAALDTTNAAFMGTTPGSAQINTAPTWGAAVNGDILATAEWCSAPLAAQTLNIGNWAAGIAADMAAHASANYNPAFILYLINGSTGASSQQIFEFVGGNLTNTAETTALLAGQGVGATVNAGDYLLLVYGVQVNGASFTPATDTYTDGATAIVADGATTADAKAFLQAPVVLTFLSFNPESQYLTDFSAERPPRIPQPQFRMQPWMGQFEAFPAAIAEVPPEMAWIGFEHRRPTPQARRIQPRQAMDCEATIVPSGFQPLLIDQPSQQRSLARARPVVPPPVDPPFVLTTPATPAILISIQIDRRPQPTARVFQPLDATPLLNLGIEVQVTGAWMPLQMPQRLPTRRRSLESADGGLPPAPQAASYLVVLESQMPTRQARPVKIEGQAAPLLWFATDTSFLSAILSDSGQFPPFGRLNRSRPAGDVPTLISIQPSITFLDVFISPVPRSQAVPALRPTGDEPALSPPILEATPVSSWLFQEAHPRPNRQTQPPGEAIPPAPFQMALPIFIADQWQAPPIPQQRRPFPAPDWPPGSLDAVRDRVWDVNVQVPRLPLPARPNVSGQAETQYYGVPPPEVVLGWNIQTPGPVRPPTRTQREVPPEPLIPVQVDMTFNPALFPLSQPFFMVRQTPNHYDSSFPWYAVGSTGTGPDITIIVPGPYIVITGQIVAAGGAVMGDITGE